MCDTSTGGFFVIIFRMGKIASRPQKKFESKNEPVQVSASMFCWTTLSSSVSQSNWIGDKGKQGVQGPKGKAGEKGDEGRDI